MPRDRVREGNSWREENEKKDKREREGKERRGNERGIRKVDLELLRIPRMAKDIVEERERERERARTRIDGKYWAQELDPQPVRNKRSFI